MSIPADLRVGVPTKKAGDKKFSMNQNLTVLFVCFITLRIMIEANRWKKNECDVHWWRLVGIPRRDAQMQQ